jgi:hypothetical protein
MVAGMMEEIEAVIEGAILVTVAVILVGLAVVLVLAGTGV